MLFHFHIVMICKKKNLDRVLRRRSELRIGRARAASLTVWSGAHLASSTRQAKVFASVIIETSMASFWHSITQMFPVDTRKRILWTLLIGRFSPRVEQLDVNAI